MRLGRRGDPEGELVAHGLTQPVVVAGGLGLAGVGVAVLDLERSWARLVGGGSDGLKLVVQVPEILQERVADDAFTVTMSDGVNPFQHDVHPIFTAKSSGVCGYEYSYANYRVDATLPGGKKLTRNIRIAQTDVSRGHFAVQRGSGDLGCENFDVTGAQVAFAYFRG